jgi:hypothetical protein
MPTGGYNTVRGYRENLPMRDNAVVASIEYQFPLLDVDGSTADFDAPAAEAGRLRRPRLGMEQRLDVRDGHEHAACQQHRPRPALAAE